MGLKDLQIVMFFGCVVDWVSVRIAKEGFTPWLRLRHPHPLKVAKKHEKDPVVAH